LCRLTCVEKYTKKFVCIPIKMAAKSKSRRSRHSLTTLKRLAKKHGVKYSGIRKSSLLSKLKKAGAITKSGKSSKKRSSRRKSRKSRKTPCPHGRKKSGGCKKKPGKKSRRSRRKSKKSRKSRRKKSRKSKKSKKSRRSKRKSGGRKKLSAYNKYVSKHMKAGKTMKEAAKLWKKSH
jgi:hypothetical protein